jgi:hypothetical protein
MDSHAHDRARERHGIALRPWTILRPIQKGEAKLVDYGEQERLIYDVPYEGTTVRVVVNKELTWVISVLPPKFARDARKQVFREQCHKARRRKHEFFRGFEGDE